MKKSYNTNYSKKVLDIFKSNKNSLITALDIFNELSKNEESINKSTVYRILDKFYSNGLIISDMRPNTSEKSYRFNEDKCKNHLHLKCVKCKKIIHLDCCCTEDIFNMLKDNHDFEMQFENSVIYGYCKDCRKM